MSLSQKKRGEGAGGWKEVGEMASNFQQLRAFAQDKGSVPSTHMVASVPGYHTPSSDIDGIRYAYSVLVYLQAKHSNT